MFINMVGFISCLCTSPSDNIFEMYFRHEQIVSKALQKSLDRMPTIANGTLSGRRPALDVDGPRMRRASKHIQKLNMGEAKDDIHVSIMCLRAIMNNKVRIESLKMND